MTATEVLGVHWTTSKEDAAPAVPAAPAAVPIAHSTDGEVNALVAEYADTLYRVAFSILRSPSEAEDAVQDCFLRLLQHRGELHTVRDQRTWLIRIVWNLALDRKRRIAPDQMDAAVIATLVARGLPADEALAEARRTAEVYLAIDALPAQEREAILLSAVEELSSVAIATLMGRSESSIRALLFRARVRLKQRLERQNRKKNGGGR